MKHYTSCHELDLIKHLNRAAFYKYINRALGQQQQPLQLNDAKGQVINVVYRTLALVFIMAEKSKGRTEGA
jgi:hypothetical protein